MSNREGTKYTFKYGCDAHHIELGTLLSTQANLKIALEEIARITSPEKKLRINALPPKPGSYEFDIILDLVEFGSLISPLILNTIEIGSIKNIFDLFISYLDLFRKLSGKTVKDAKQVGDKIHINIEGDNNTVIVDNKVHDAYQKNRTLGSATRNTFQELSRNNQIESFSINKDDKNIYQAKKKDFDKYAVPIDEDYKDKLVKTTLIITKAVLDLKQNWKWGFKYKGLQINAMLSDRNFKRKIIEKDLRFGPGDALEVELKIHKEFDPKYNEYVDKSYEVVQVFHHIPHSIQTNLGL